MKRGRPPRSDDQLRRLVEYLENRGATRKSAAIAFRTVERNIDAMLKDPRAQTWSRAPSSMRSFIREFEAYRAESHATLRKYREAERLLWRDPKFKFIEKELNEEDLRRIGDLSLDDAYQFALGHAAHRRAAQR
jgi:hypothetical protein